MEYHRALQLRALRAVMAPDEDAQRRSIYRWYSKTFATPLHVVEELDPDDILTAYYEQSYEEMGPEDRHQELRDLLKSPEERREERRVRDAERADALEFAQFSVEEERRREAKKLADVKVQDQQHFTKVPAASLPTAPLKEIKDLPAGIQMKFLSEDDFEAELDRPRGPEPKPGKP